MSLTGQSLPTVLAILAIALFAALVVGWPRLRGLWSQRASRGATAVLLNVVVLLFAAVQLNDQYAFYVSWSDLMGVNAPEASAHHGATAAQAANGKVMGEGLTKVKGQSIIKTLTASGRLQSFEVTGQSTGIRGKVLVYLPQGYDPNSTKVYPVIEALHGYPGTPESLINYIGFEKAVDHAVAAHKMAAPIVVIPQINTPSSLDTECVNAPGGLQTETWISTDVPTWTAQHFRVSTARTSWATFGYSFGGFCSAILGIHHPDVFGASIVMQGYFRPDFDVSYEPFRPGSASYRYYDLVHQAIANPPALSLWILSSKQDALSYPSTAALVKDAKVPLSVTAVILKSGGHRASLWIPKIPQSLAWLGGTLPGFKPAAG